MVCINISLDSLLKSRFKRLRPLVQGSVEQMMQTISAACILHNICIMSEDDMTFAEDVDQELPLIDADLANDIFAEQDRARGSIKRLNIARRILNR